MTPDIWRCAAANLDWYAILVAAETLVILVAIGGVYGSLLRRIGELRKRIETLEARR